MENLLSAINEIGKKLHELDSKLSSKIDNLDEKFCQFQSEMGILKKNQENQEKRIDQLKREIRTRNLVLFGVTETENSYFDLEKLIIKIINQKLNVECTLNEIEHARRLGRKNERPRPIVIGFTTLGKKIKILKNKSKLEGTQMYIKNDYPTKILKEREALQEELKEKKASGKNAVLIYNKLVILPNNKKSSPRKTQLEVLNKKRILEKSPLGEDKNKSEQMHKPKKNKTSMENEDITQYLSFQRKRIPELISPQDSDLEDTPNA